MFSRFNFPGAIENNTLTDGACQSMVMRRRPFQVFHTAASTPAFEFMKALFKKGRSRDKGQQTRKSLVDYFEKKLKKARYGNWSHPSTYVEPKPDTSEWWAEVAELWMRGDLKNRSKVHNPIFFVNAMFETLENQTTFSPPQSNISRYFEQKSELSGFEDSHDSPPECAITEDEEESECAEESEPEHEFLKLLKTTEWKQLYDSYN